MKGFYNQTSSNSTLQVPYDYTPTNEQAAWFAIAYTAACIHGDITEEGRAAFCKLITSKELFRGHEILDYLFEIMDVKDELEPKEIIRRAATLVSREHAPTLFCIVTETLLAKGYLTAEEEDLLDYIGKKLALDSRITSKIIEVIRLKNKGNCIYN
jgi:hypothetical protein